MHHSRIRGLVISFNMCWFCFFDTTVLLDVRSFRNTNAPTQDIPTAKVLIEALSPAPSPTGKAKRPPVEVRTLNIRVGLPHEDYPDQENMLVDLAQIMQVRRKRANH